MAEYMKDSKGRLVPVSNVKVTDKLRDDVVNNLVAAAKLEQEGLKAFKKSSYEDVHAFVGLVAAEHDVKFGGLKGNISLLSFDGCRKVNVAISENITFDESLQVAKDKLDDLLLEWSNGANENIRIIIMDAFKVDQEGKISVTRLLELRRYEVQDERWKDAMNIISNSVVIAGSKSYIRFYERDTPDGEWQAISLDIAKLEV